MELRAIVAFPLVLIHEAICAMMAFQLFIDGVSTTPNAVHMAVAHVSEDEAKLIQTSRLETLKD